MANLTQPQRRYDLAQSMFGQAVAPTRNAGAIEGIAKILQAYFASRGMRGAEQQERDIIKKDKDDLALAMDRGLGAYRGDTPYQMGEDELFPGEQPIQGLRNKGAGSNVGALAESMLTSGRKELMPVALQTLMSQPKEAKAPTMQEISVGSDPNSGKPLFQKVTWSQRGWQKQGEPYTKGASTEVNIGTGPQLTPGQKKVDESFSDIYSDFVLSGGYADIDKQIAQLRGVAEKLDESESLTGAWVGMTPDWIASFINPESVSAREDVEEVVQRNLRLILGAQFTEKEGERLIARAYNPKLDEKVNVKRISRLLNQMSQAAEAKREAARYFQEHGTLKGFTGRLWTINDFDIDSGADNTDNPQPENEKKVIKWSDL